MSFGKSSVYRTVQETAEKVPGMKRTELLKSYQTRALGADLTSVKCKGQWLPIGVVVDPINGLVLSIDHLEGEDAQNSEGLDRAACQRSRSSHLGDRRCRCV